MELLKLTSPAAAVRHQACFYCLYEGGIGLKVFLNGKEIGFAEGGYEYIFVKPYQRHSKETVKKGNGELILQMYDNGVQIRTLVTKEEVATLINRDVMVDRPNRKIYILEPDSKAKQNEDGSVEILD
jgi:hypothetical protein